MRIRQGDLFPAAWQHSRIDKDAHTWDPGNVRSASADLYVNKEFFSPLSCEAITHLIWRHYAKRYAIIADA